VLPEDFAALGVDDSKKLSEKKREELYALIMEAAIAVGLGAEDNLTIDRVNILEATKLAMRSAVEEASARLAEREGEGAKIGHLLIDALTLPGIAIPQSGIVKGDEKCLSVAAASIVAKVTRDRLMARCHEAYPAYSFDRNKGYGTKAHYQAIAAAGLCPIHRRSFCRGARLPEGGV
ncbi:MAG: ribonuclease HII, partial [Clostridiales Family XIII bacterium]|jgi:ribonuclease HII|nr:ribonuclease HII [Clostridiales Family XIII bacterium]